MSTFIHDVIRIGVMAGLLVGAAGCTEEHNRYERTTPETTYQYDEHGYRYENGDRIDRSGHRDVHWCAAHPEDEHCR